MNKKEVQTEKLFSNYSSLPNPNTDVNSDIVSIEQTHHMGMDYGVLAGIKSGNIYQQSRLVPQNTYNFYPLSQINSHQTKSLQELQNEVGALLEFRDLVIETFPDLKNKMVSMSNAGTNDNNLTVNSSSNSLATRREWEPGVKLRRKNFNKDVTIHQSSSIHNNGLGDISSTLTRHRSDSQIGKKEPKSGEGGNGSVIQDSGFSTETSSTKETHSSSSAGGVCQIVSSRPTVVANESEDELLNLLDVIHRKSVKLRDEFEKFQSNNIENNFPSKCDQLQKSPKISFTECPKIERDELLEKLADVEADRALGQIKIEKLQNQIYQMRDSKKNLEGQLKKALNNSTNKHTRDLEKSTITIMENIDSQSQDNIKQTYSKLGNLDSILTPFHKTTKVRNVDSTKISAILLETSVVELQRHLLRLCVQNQAILHTLHKTTRSKIFATRKLEKSVELIDDLRFQLEEKNIELEGSRAQLRIAESPYLKKTLNIDENNQTSSLIEPNLKISPPSMREMHHIEITDIGIHDSSGTESTCYQMDKDNEKEMPCSKRNKPSKIPLPGKQLARSPTSGLNTSSTAKSTPKAISRSVCNLSKSISVGNTNKSEIISNSCSIAYMNKNPSSCKYNTSPTLKTRRDSSHTLRGKNIDSLSSSSKTNIRPKGNIPSFRNETFQSSNSISRKHSSISLGSTKQHSEDVGKVRNIRSAFWSWLKMS